MNGQQVIVFAGAWTGYLEQGFIAVKGDVRSTQPLIGNYHSPSKSGTLYIVDFQGSRLVIKQADSDQLLFFDIPALSHVSSSEAVVPTITPIETSLPRKATQVPFPYTFPGPWMYYSLLYQVITAG